MESRLTTELVLNSVFECVSHRFSLLRILSLVASALAVASCASTQLEWEPISDQEAILIFDDSKVDIIATNRARHDSDRIFVESIDLEHTSGELAGSGNLTYWETAKYSDEYFFDDRKTLSERIISWFESDTKIKLGRSKEEENHMGPYDQQRFTLDPGYDCAAIEQHLGPTPIDGLPAGKVALGTIIINGYYCAGGNDFLSEGQVKSIFNAIDVPSRPKEEVRAY